MGSPKGSLNRKKRRSTYPKWGEITETDHSEPWLFMHTTNYVPLRAESPVTACQFTAESPVTACQFTAEL